MEGKLKISVKETSAKTWLKAVSFFKKEREQKRETKNPESNKGMIKYSKKE
jgi:hypothetical protein